MPVSFKNVAERRKEAVMWGITEIVRENARVAIKNGADKLFQRLSEKAKEHGFEVGSDGDRVLQISLGKEPVVFLVQFFCALPRAEAGFRRILIARKDFERFAQEGREFWDVHSDNVETNIIRIGLKELIFTSTLDGGASGFRK